MTHKNYYIILGCVLGIVSLAHLVRAVFGISLIVGGWSVPIWLSWLAFVVAGYLSYTSFRFVAEKLHLNKI